MKASERDDVLARLDERTNNIWRSVEKLEAHAAETNGSIRDCIKNVTATKELAKLNRTIIIGIISTAGGCLGIHLGGWW